MSFTQLLYLGDFDAARAVLEPLIARFRREGSFFDLAHSLGTLAALECQMGRLASAEAAASEAVALAIEVGLPYSECLSLSFLAFAEAMLGRHADCEHDAQRVFESVGARRAADASARARYALGLSALTSGRIEQAIEELEHCREVFADTPATVSGGLI